MFIHNMYTLTYIYNYHRLIIVSIYMCTHYKIFQADDSNIDI